MLAKMKRLTFALGLAFSLCMVVMACAKKKGNGDMVAETKKDGKVLVAYFSATGTTERVAKMIAEATGGELYKIRPQEEYSSKDLDWTDKVSRCSRENDDPKSRPAIVKDKESLDAYEVIYLGFPNWWNMAPRIVNTFVEAYGLKGKKVVPFMTSGGSEIENSVSLLRKDYPEVDWQEGKLLNQATLQDIEDWVK